MSYSDQRGGKQLLPTFCENSGGKREYCTCHQDKRDFAWKQRIAPCWSPVTTTTKFSQQSLPWLA